MTAENPEELLKPYGVSRESLAQLETYVSLLLTWQQRINLIGPSTVDTVWSRHILDAVQLIPLLPKNTKVIADLGSGAGIPGLILAISGGYEVHLYESNGKKAAFLAEAIRQTGANAHVHQIRLEQLAMTAALPKADVIVARALAPLDQLLRYSEPFFKWGARAYFHKGQDLEAELTSATKYWRIKLDMHPSHSDSRGVIVEVKEAVRVRA